MNHTDYILYKNLDMNRKNIIKDYYYQYINLNLKEIKNILPFKVSLNTLKKVLKDDFFINLRRTSKYIVNDFYFNQIENEQQAYILGLIASDGFVGEKSNQVSIALNDKDILEEIKQVISFSGEIKTTKKGGFENSKEGYLLYLNSEQMKNDLNNLGIYSRKSLTFDRIPNIPNHLKRHFLRGYFDGDGSITSYQRKYVVNNREYCYNRMIMTIIATSSLIDEFIKEFNIEKYSISKSKNNSLKYLQISSKEELKKCIN